MRALSFGPGDCDVLVEQGPTLLVNIGFDPTYRRGQAPALQGSVLPALVDTGATLSCVDSQLAIALNLPVVNRSCVSGVGGRTEVNEYLAQIYIPQLGYTIYGKFHGVHLVSGGQSHVALIGRAFLKAFILTYDGITGTVQLSRPPQS